MLNLLQLDMKVQQEEYGKITLANWKFTVIATKNAEIILVEHHKEHNGEKDYLP